MNEQKSHEENSNSGNSTGPTLNTLDNKITLNMTGEPQNTDIP